MSIHILSSDIVNQIAAGEVVERPSHLVKELVENSLDAGANDIEIEVDDGGRNVRVTDNGSGIRSNELTLALSRHATSKLQAYQDLFHLSSYGFRGEALASIAAVSNLTLSSKSSEEDGAFRIRSEFGRVSDLEPVGHGQGTSVQIRELFANVPARLKFLKSESAEISQIRLMLKALALGRPDVTFRVRSRGQVTDLWSQANSRLERAQQLLGLAPLYSAKSSAPEGECEIVFSSPHNVAKTSKQIWIFVQDRWVQDRSLQAAVIDAYRSLLMHGEFPHAVVWLNCPPESVDVNVHPTKSQIKFQNASAMFRLVHHTLRDELEKAPWREHLGQREQLRTQTVFTVPAEVTPVPTTPVFQAPEFFTRQTKTKEFVSEGSLFAPPKVETMPAAFAPPPVATVTTTEAVAGFWSQLEVLGQLHLTYILAQSDQALLLIDQHAAHERVNFEKLMKAWREQQVEKQNYLLPLSIDLENDQVEALLSQTAELAKLGLDIEQGGPGTLVVNAHPVFIDDSGIVKALTKLAAEMLDVGGSFAFEKSVVDICATMACHSSVRAGQALSVQQMRELLKSMDPFPLSTFCPHGRPVHLEYSFAKLEREFGRIV